MSAPQPSPERARFGDFEFDRDAGELSKNGARISLPEQPLRLLEIFLEHPGKAVLRDQLRERLWAADTFVDFEHGLNAAVKRLRDALGDSADQPRFIETIPKRGYRFIAAVDDTRAAATSRGTLETTKPRRSLMAAAAVAAGIVAAITWWVWPNRATPEPESELPRRLTRLTFEPGLQTDPTFSPDGRHVAYAADRAGNFDIWMQPIDGGPAVQLTSDPADDLQPDWLPDGRSIVFRSERDGGGLFRLSLADRHVQRIAEFGYFPRASPDGARLLYGSGLLASTSYYVANANGTDAAEIHGAPTATTSGRHLSAIGWHPRGHLVLLHGRPLEVRLGSVAPGSHNVVERSVALKVQERFSALQLYIADRERLAWSPDGANMYFAAMSSGVLGLWRLRMDPQSLAVLEGPERVTTGSGWDARPVAMRHGNGLAFSSSAGVRRVWLFELDASGRTVNAPPVPLTLPEWDVLQATLSPDGRAVAAVVDRVGSRLRELRLLNLDDQAQRTLRTVERGRENLWAPRWSPDGQLLAYSYRFGPLDARRSSIRVLQLQSLQETNITSDSPYTAADNPWGWSPRGDFILANGSRYVAAGAALVRLPVGAAPSAERRASVVVSSADHGLWQAAESPDGRWVCYSASALRGRENSALYVAPATGGPSHLLTDITVWDDKPQWSADGRLLYFLSSRGGRFALWALGFDPNRGLANGVPFLVTQFATGPRAVDLYDNDTALSDLSVVGSKVVLTLQLRSGGIWLLE